MDEFYVYILFRPWDGTPFYVGKGKNHRWLDHRRPSTKYTNRHLASVIRKAARLGLEIPCVKLRDHISEAEAFRTEVALIAAIGRGKAGPLVNATDGGEGAAGAKRSEETRAKMSAALKGKAGPVGIKRSEETRAKLRAAATLRTPEIFAKISAAHRGKVLTADHRAKLSAAHTGKSLSAEHRANIGKAHLGKKRSAAARDRMRSAMKRDAKSGRWILSLDANNLDLD